MNFDTIIPFCSYDKKYINDVLAGVRDLADNIYVIYCDKLFDGTPEDQAVIEKVKNDNPDCKFFEMQFDHRQDSRWHHNNARWIGVQMSKAPRVLFIDADEEFETVRFREWLNSQKTPTDITYFKNYWYFRDKKYQALTYENSPVLITREIANKKELLFTNVERNVYMFINYGTKNLEAVGLDGLPMCHHYSWALTKEEMLQKVKSWSHRGDKNWVEEIEKEFSHDFNGTDFVHGYSYRILE